MTHYTKKQLIAVEKRLNSMYNEHSYFGMITITSRLDEKKDKQILAIADKIIKRHSEMERASIVKMMTDDQHENKNNKRQG